MTDNDDKPQADVPNTPDEAPSLPLPDPVPNEAMPLPLPDPQLSDMEYRGREPLAGLPPPDTELIDTAQEGRE